MALEVKVPAMGESITEATIAGWHYQVGSEVKNGDILVELETDKVTLEVPSPVDGVLKEIKHDNGVNIAIGDVIAIIDEKVKTSLNTLKKSSSEVNSLKKPELELRNDALSPAVSRLVEENNIDISKISGSGKREQVTKSDIIEHLKSTPDVSEYPIETKVDNFKIPNREDRERIEPLSRLRQRIAERLVHSQRTSASLTTFNEIDMQRVIDIRKQYKDIFKKEYGVGLGFMSIFIKATINALKVVPSLNAEIRDNNIVYKNYHDISVAVGGPKGLVVPVIRDADALDFAGIEAEIIKLGNKVKEGSISLEELEGGTFTISNGGIYGSMMSTPILNPPQSGVLGMHNIVKRPVVINGEITIRPIMYVALSYDHRIVDGKEAVTFLVKVKEGVENPERILLGI